MLFCLDCSKSPCKLQENLEKAKTSLQNASSALLFMPVAVGFAHDQVRLLLSCRHLFDDITARLFAHSPCVDLDSKSFASLVPDPHLLALSPLPETPPPLILLARPAFGSLCQYFNYRLGLSQPFVYRRIISQYVVPALIASTVCADEHPSRELTWQFHALI